MVQVHVPQGVGVRVPPWAPAVLVARNKNKEFRITHFENAVFFIFESFNYLPAHQ
jgi:hypothetical protein